MENVSTKVRRITLMGLLLAMTVILSAVEHALPPIPLPNFPASVRLGLGNIIIMYTLYFLGGRYALAMAVLKSLFVGLSRGAQAGYTSLGGGLLSVILMLVLVVIFKDKISYIIVSVVGALGHNFGQMIVASLEFRVNMVAIYWPILIISGIVFGVITGIMLKVIMPIFTRISGLAPKLEKSNKGKARKGVMEKGETDEEG